MLFKYILPFILLTTTANATPYVRQHADTIVADKKIKASDLNDEFNAIATAVNNIDSSNISDGSLTANDFAATSSAVSLNKKTGCRFFSTQDVTGNKLVSITPPCEIFMDGLRGFITATSTISLLSNLADGSLSSASYYYIYATRNTASLGFQFSQTIPDLVTNRKSSDSTARYVGFVRTQDASSDIVRFNQNMNEFFWSQDSDVVKAGLIATPTTISGAFSLSVPKTVSDVLLKYQAYTTTTFPAQCEFSVSDIRPRYQAIVTATGGNTGVVPIWVPLSDSQTITAFFRNIKECVTGGDLRVIGWRDRFSLHE